MKKILAISSAALFVAVFSFSMMSFRGDPKKKTTESATTTQCEKQKDKAACQDSKKGTCCEKKCDKSSGKCCKQGDAATGKK
jgi:hypothetical protein